LLLIYYATDLYIKVEHTKYSKEDNVKEITEMSDNGIQFLIREEGLVKRPYRDAAGIPTIGVGMTYYPDTGRKVQMTDPELTTDQALKYLRLMLKSYELGVYSVTRDDLNPNQFDALTSFTYNIGNAGLKNSTLLKKVNANIVDPEIADAFLAYSKATINGTKRPILLGRRRREADLYFKSYNPPILQDQLYINHIKHIQKKLGLVVDGIFGAKTKATILEFQKVNGLIADGVVGPQTLAELNGR
jgi:lysozyme